MDRLEEQHLFQGMQLEGLDILGQSGMIVWSDTFIPYTSGKIGNYKIQSDVLQFSKNVRLYERAIDLVQMLYTSVEACGTSPTTIITGGETKDWLFSIPVAERMCVYHTRLCKDGQTIGRPLEHSTVTHIADVNNNGSSMRDVWCPIIKQEGGTLEHVLFFVEREEGGRAVLDSLGIDYHSVVHLTDNAWEYLHRRMFIGDETYTSILDYRADKEAWAREMLQNDCGIARLSELSSSRNPRDRMAAQKILAFGYPDLKEKLYGRMHLLPQIAHK